MASKKNNLSQIIPLVSQFWLWIVGISLSIVIASFLRQAPPQIQRSLVDYLSNNSLPSWFGITASFVGLITAYFLVVIALTLLDRLTWALTNRFDSRFGLFLRQKAYNQLLDLSIGYYNKQRSGSLMSKVDRGVSRITNMIRNVAANILPNIVTAILAVFIVGSVRWEIAAWVILGFVLYFPMRLSRFRHVEKLDKKIHKLWDTAYGHFYEAISSIRLVKSFAAERYELNLFGRFAKKSIRFGDEQDRIENRFVVVGIFLNVWMATLFGYIFYLGLRHEISLGTIILLVQYIDIIRQPFSSLEWTFWEIKRGQVGARDYLKIINAKDYTYQPVNPVLPEKFQGEIVFENVSFRYPEKGGQHVFNKFNLKIEPGTTIAVVGRSGAGKTTLAHLLVRFFDADAGSVLVDGNNITEINLSTLRQNVGLVMQQNYLFADTIVENLRYGRPSATLNEMKESCRVANADEFIEKLPKKYFTKIGERGIKLSGGQQQRLSIARTVLKNPPILILDEATSSLDSHSERLVQDALNKLIKGRTTIIIAHRLSTIQQADKIIVLGKQNILEEGTHAELIKKKNGIYASLHQIQSGQVEKLKEWDIVS